MKNLKDDRNPAAGLILLKSQYSRFPSFKTPFFDMICRRSAMNYRTFIILFFSIHLFLLLPLSVQSQSDTSATAAGDPVLVQAQMCEDLQERIPQNVTTVFSIERRKAICFTSFDPVPGKTVIYHHWFHRDRPSARIKLSLKPPRWSTYSSIQFRAQDVGPWRVEITDSKGHIFHILRFSITE
jgi:hypothetical protein